MSGEEHLVSGLLIVKCFYPGAGDTCNISHFTWKDRSLGSTVQKESSVFHVCQMWSDHERP